MMEQWIEFNLIKRPYYDARGDILLSINDRMNRPEVDPFTGGGKVYPSFEKVVVKERYEKGDKLLVLVEGTQEQLDVLKKVGEVSYQASPKTTLTVQDGFKQVTKTDEESTIMKESFFGIVKPLEESGVTK